MTKSGLHFLAKYVSERHKVNQREAVKFVRAFFDLLNEGLQEQKLVKVRGLGTFKVIDVKDRESVDVNTGERIIIEGRSKISFVPDNLMKDLVNKPFSQFETVVLNDGVDFQDIETLFSEDSDDETLEKERYSTIVNSDSDDYEDDVLNVVEEKGQTIEQSGDSSSVVGSVEEVKDNVSNDFIEQQEGVEQLNHEVVAMSQPISSEKKEALTLATDDEKTTNPEKTIIAEQKDKEPAASVSYNEHQMDSKYNKHVGYSFFNWFWNIIAALIIAVLSFFGGMHYERKDMSNQLSKVVSQYNTEKSTKSQENIVIQNTETVKSLGDTQNETKDNKKIIEQQTVAVPSNQQKNEQPKKQEEVQQDGKLERENSQTASEEQNSIRVARQIVSTGAYNIIGTETTVKVRKGQTLKSISRVYLGDGMDCYVIVHNGFSVVSEGQTLKIPKLQLKKIKKRK